MTDVIQESSVLKIQGDVEFDELDLSAQEGFILSRIDGKISVAEIYQLSLLDRDSTAIILKRLLDNEIIQLVDDEKTTTEKKTKLEAPERDYNGYIFNLLELQEEVELPEEIKKEILFVYHNFNKFNHYELLNIPMDASETTIRNAFLKLSKIYHPDAYFRKSLGSYRGKINEIYNMLARAHSTLIDMTLRMEYRRELIEQGKLEASPDDIMESPEEKEKRLKKERDKRRIHRNPMQSKVKKAREFYEAGLSDMEQDAVISAANNFKLASVYDPHNEVFKAKAEQVGDLANRAVSERIYQKALGLRAYGQDGYFELFVKAADMCPNGAVYNFEAAQLYCDQADWREALPYAKKAVASEPKNAKHNLLLGKIMLKLREKSEAVRYLEISLKINPKDNTAKKLLKEAKRWF